MDEYSTNNSAIDINGLTKFKAFADRLAARKVLDEDNLSRWTRVSVEGYDTSLRAGDIKYTLREHFRSCGKICNVVIYSDPVERCGFIYFLEEDAQEKALALSGSDVGGWKVFVKALPKKVCEFSPDQVDSARRLIHSRQCGFVVTGYDTSLPADVVRSALFRLFSSCGEIIYLTIEEDRSQPGLLKSSGFIRILGEDALEKALELSGSDLGGWNVAVKTLPKPNGNTVYPTVGYPGPPGYRWSESGLF